jgi:XRE family transcriptional regulator, stress-response regulator
VPIEQRDADDRPHRELADVLAFPVVETRPAEPEPGLRPLIGGVLRDERLEQQRTLADVARAAAVSLPYLSEVERGRKEISSDLLDAVCDALEIPLVEVLERCVDRLRAGMQRGSGLQLCAA